MLANTSQQQNTYNITVPSDYPITYFGCHKFTILFTHYNKHTWTQPGISITPLGWKGHLCTTLWQNKIAIFFWASALHCRAIKPHVRGHPWDKHRCQYGEGLHLQEVKNVRVQWRNCLDCSLLVPVYERWPLKPGVGMWRTEGQLRASLSMG